MPKRVIDFDAMWGSDKLAACAEWAQAEYAWLYGLADASGCFEVSNLRVIWGRVAAIRRNLTIERLEQVFLEFQEKGLLFVWEHEGKQYAHWTGSDVPGRLPAPSWRMRLEKFAPPVPKQRLAEYMGRFARGRAGLAGAGFRGEAAGEAVERKEKLKDEKSGMPGGRMEDLQLTDSRLLVGDVGIKAGLEETQGQDLDLGLNGNLKGNGSVEEKWGGEWEKGAIGNHIRKLGINFDSEFRANSNSQFVSNSNAEASANSDANALAKSDSNSDTNSNSRASSLLRPDCGSSEGRNSNTLIRSNSNSRGYSNGFSYVQVRGMSAKELATEKELRVGQGPVCGPKGIKPEILERIRLRDAARAGRK